MVVRSLLGESRLWGAITLVLLLCAAGARADDARYQDYPIGTRAMALGGAFVALSDDPSGLYYNPAGICDTRRLNVSVSGLAGKARPGALNYSYAGAGSASHFAAARLLVFSDAYLVGRVPARRVNS